MTRLHRHQIAGLTPDGWWRVLERDWDATARACLAHWAVHRLPLVVTRQPRHDAASSAIIAMGLPAPARWERRRIALGIPRGDVLYFDEFPSADKVAQLLPAAAHGEWHRLCAGLNACGVVARVYGSYGWRRITGLDHLRSGSDIDIWVAVSHSEQADAVAAVLRDFACTRPRIDGELVFGGDTAVAWREWLAWRAGHTTALLVKTIAGTSISRSVEPVHAIDVAEALL